MPPEQNPKRGRPRGSVIYQPVSLYRVGPEECVPFNAGKRCGSMEMTFSGDVPADLAKVAPFLDRVERRSLAEHSDAWFIRWFAAGAMTWLLEHAIDEIRNR